MKHTHIRRPSRAIVCICALTTGALGIASLCAAQPDGTEQHYSAEDQANTPYGSTPSEQAFIEKAQRFAIENKRRQNLESESWISEKWTGDNKPYRAITAGIAKLIGQKQLKRALARFDSEASVNPTSASLQYRFVLADFSLEMQNWPIQRSKVLRWREMLAGPDSPQTLDYSRLRFMVEAVYSANRKIKPLGLRLLQVTPDDKWVAFFVDRVKKASTDAQDIQENLKQAYLKLKSDPNDKSALSTIVRERMKIWAKSSKRSDANAAITAYKQYQRILPVGSPDIASINERINQITKDQANFDR